MARKRKPRLPPLGRAFLHELVDAMQRESGASLISRDAVDEWARRNLDGRSRAEREKAIGGPFFHFLAGECQATTRRLWARYAARHPSEN